MCVCLVVCWVGRMFVHSTIGVYGCDVIWLVACLAVCLFMCLCVCLFGGSVGFVIVRVLVCLVVRLFVWLLG